jgi:CHAT domain-containing protein
VLPFAFADYLEVALTTGDMERAAHAAQLLLLSELALTNARIAAASIARREGLGAGVERLDTARAEVTRIGSELAAAQASAEETAGPLLAALAEAQTEAALAQGELRAAFPDFVNLARPQIATLAQLQAELGEGEMLVLPVALPGRAVTLAITHDRAEWGEARISAFQLGELAAEVRQTAERPVRFDTEAAYRLFRTVFPESLVPMLAASNTLLFPASGYLARLSPAVLLTAPGEATDLASAPWLVRSHALRIVPDLAALGSHTPLAAPERFLGVGAPLLSDPAAAWAGLPPLPTAGAELAALADALGAGESTLLTSAQATEASLAARDLSSYRVIAFATHGLVGGEVAGLAEPALVMSTPLAGDAGDDGLLTASEIARLRLDADWVILTACNTATGDQVGSPGYSGLARAFAQAGARSLMLSHWRVRDDAATFLSVETVRRAATGLPRAEALRQAQLALIARGDVPDAAHPAVWAPFVIVGD